MTTIYAVAAGILLAGAVLGIFALLKMRLPVEKMVALDTLTTLICGILVIAALAFHSRFILDVTMVYAVLSFGAVLVIARVHEGGV